MSCKAEESIRFISAACCKEPCVARTAVRAGNEWSALKLGGSTCECLLCADDSSRNKPKRPGWRPNSQMTSPMHTLKFKEVSKEKVLQCFLFGKWVEKTRWTGGGFHNLLESVEQPAYSKKKKTKRTQMINIQGMLQRSNQLRFTNFSSFHSTKSTNWKLLKHDFTGRMSP
jgi:hypothetical protein